MSQERDSFVEAKLSKMSLAEKSGQVLTFTWRGAYLTPSGIEQTTRLHAGGVCLEPYALETSKNIDHANTMITPDNLRAELEQEQGESAPGPHYIVAAYPRPGAVWTHLVMNHIKDLQAKSGSPTVGSRQLMPFFPGLLKDA